MKVFHSFSFLSERKNANPYVSGVLGFSTAFQAFSVKMFSFLCYNIVGCIFPVKRSKTEKANRSAVFSPTLGKHLKASIK